MSGFIFGGPLGPKFELFSTIKFFGCVRIQF